MYVRLSAVLCSQHPICKGKGTEDALIHSNLSVCTLHRPKYFESINLHPTSETCIKIPDKLISHISEDEFCFEASRNSDVSTFLYKLSTFQHIFNFFLLQIKSNFFLDMLPCSSVDRYQFFGETYSVRLSCRTLK
jgi:hypothetical protein